MIGVGLGVVAKRRYSGFPPPLRSFWQRVRDDGGTMQDYNSAISLYRSNNDALLAVSASATKAGKLYSVIPTDGSGDFSVTAAKGRRINKNGLIESVATNVPRINWVAGKPYILREAQATNRLLRSEDFSDVYWNKDGVIPEYNTIETLAPNGTQTATLINEGNTNAVHRVTSSLINFSLKNGVSVFVKYKSIRYVRLSIGGEFNNPELINRRADFDLVNGTILRNTDYTPTAKIEPIANGWFRISFIMLEPSILTENRFTITLLDVNGSDTLVYTGTNREVYIWGAQLEATNLVSSYIKTVAATETRDADIISVALPAGTAKVTTNFRTGSPLIDESPTTPYTMPVGEIESVIMED
jgi:hypothetical protein